MHRLSDPLAEGNAALPLLQCGFAAASQEQIDAIHRYAARFGLDSLPEALKGTALLRITNPEASLSDLAALSCPKVSKSCLSHRLKKIRELADEEALSDIGE